MNEMEFIAYWCEPLTQEQTHMAQYFIKRGGFLGVGHAVGPMLMWPLVTRNGKQAEAIDRAGYSQLASMEGRKGYPATITVTKRRN